MSQVVLRNNVVLGLPECPEALTQLSCIYGGDEVVFTGTFGDDVSFKGTTSPADMGYLVKASKSLTDLHVWCDGWDPEAMRCLNDGLVESSSPLTTVSLCASYPDGHPKRHAFDILGQTLAQKTTLRRLRLIGLLEAGSDTRRLASHFRGNTSLVQLDIEDEGRFDIGVQSLDLASFEGFLVGSTSLQVLNLEEINITNREMVELGRLLHGNMSIKYLSLAYNKIGAGVAQLDGFLRGNGTIETLLLTDNRIDDVSMAVLADSLTTATALKRLALADNPICNAGMKHLGRILRSNRLVELELSRCGISDAGCVYLGEGLQGNASLGVLDLANNCITHQGLNHLEAFLRWCDTLVSMNLSNTWLANPAATLLGDALKANRTLITLDLSGTAIGAEEIEGLGPYLKASTALKTLQLRSNHMDDKAMVALGQSLCRNRTLAILRLWNNFSIEGLYSFCDHLRGNYTLRHVDVSWNPLLTSLPDNLGNILGLERLQVDGSSTSLERCPASAASLWHLTAVTAKVQPSWVKDLIRDNQVFAACQPSVLFLMLWALRLPWRVQLPTEMWYLVVRDFVRPSST